MARTDCTRRPRLAVLAAGWILLLHAWPASGNTVLLSSSAAGTGDCGGPISASLVLVPGGCVGTAGPGEAVVDVEIVSALRGRLGLTLTDSLGSVMFYLSCQYEYSLNERWDACSVGGNGTPVRATFGETTTGYFMHVRVRLSTNSGIAVRGDEGQGALVTYVLVS